MAGKPRTSVQERFLSHVSKDEDGCWRWMAYRMSNGYGLFSFDGANRLAHRVSHKLFIGPVDERDVMHRCDNPACVNPEHLSLGTRTENMGDAKRKGRMVRGEAHGRAKLTHEQAMFAKSAALTQREIAERLGVTQSYVSEIRNGKKWGHLHVEY